MFSYHGVPERHIRKSDITKSHCKIDNTCCKTHSKAHEFCYRHQCYEVTRLVAEKLQLKPETFSTSFQSRLGFDPWLQPYTDLTMLWKARKFLKKWEEKSLIQYHALMIMMHGLAYYQNGLMSGILVIN